MNITDLDWNHHTHIGVDLDETLAGTMSGFLDHAHGLGKLLVIKSIADVSRYDARGLGEDISKEEVYLLWESYGKSSMDPLSVPPLDGALDGIKALMSMQKNLSIVTARSNMEPWKVERTYNWVGHYLPFLPRESIHFVNHFSKEARPKSDVCKSHNITLMIDDALENAKELTEHGIACILIEKPWNREQEYMHPLLYRASNWNEIRKYLPLYDIHIQ